MYNEHIFGRFIRERGADFIKQKVTFSNMVMWTFLVGGTIYIVLI